MLEIEISHRANQELETIWEYSFEQWGEAQADRYLDKLNVAIKQIATNPKIGAPRDNIRTDLRAYHIGRHVIYYYIQPDMVYVVRVRHDSSDPYLYED